MWPSCRIKLARGETFMTSRVSHAQKLPLPLTRLILASRRASGRAPMPHRSTRVASKFRHNQRHQHP
jgi:hypothetical protein